AALRREGGAWANDDLAAFGATVGSGEVIEWGFLANTNLPRLVTHDRYGHRIDRVEYHPAWHSLMKLSVAQGLHSLPWERGPGGAYAARAAGFFVMAQIEQGHGCPISMTTSVIPSLRLQADLAAEWEPDVLSRTYDPAFAPRSRKAGVLLGMALTEKQGGSDVRSNASRAVPIDGGGPGGEYALTGHKWFCSAPMCDAFLVLAQAPGGLSCFLLPRWTPDNEPNRVEILRLKDKLGNRSNASSEIEFEGAWGRMVGDEGRGVRTIIEMINHTRLDCVIGSAAIMRQAVTQAVHHSRHRTAFGATLVHQPLMQNVLADLVIESEAATLLMMRLAGAFDRREDPFETLFLRMATSIGKYWVCKRTPMVTGEALECLGGNGYVEESNLPRLYRESPVNSVWEGSGNVIALDVVRAMNRAPDSLEAVLAEIDLGAGVDDRLDVAIRHLQDALGDLQDVEQQARRLVEELALVLGGSLLVRHGPSSVADAFLASRFGSGWGRAFGTLPGGLDLEGIIGRTVVA
ncbi:MAG: acyl-CoA dehydrogenase family protein, partial [Acidimicrobiia bacterium]